MAQQLSLLKWLSHLSLKQVLIARNLFLFDLTIDLKNVRWQLIRWAPLLFLTLAQQIDAGPGNTDNTQ